MRIKIEDIRIGNEYFAVSFDMGGVPTANYIRAEGVELLYGKYYIVCQNSKYKLENLRYTEAEMWTLIDDILSTIGKNIVEQYKDNKRDFAQASRNKNSSNQIKKEKENGNS